MKSFTKEFLKFFKNKIILAIASLALLSLILVWILWLWQMREFGQIYSPLFSNQFFGNFASYSLPVFATIVFFINLILSQKSFFKERLISFFLLGAALFVQILGLILVRFYLAQGF